MSHAGSNAYGFDFLKAEHNLPHQSSDETTAESSQNGSPPPSRQTSNAAALASTKNDLEKQFDVIHFLQAHRSSGCLPPSVIYKEIGIDLSDGGTDHGVAKMLEKNPKIRMEELPDPENPSLTIMTYGYQAKFNNIHNKVGLLAQINRCKNGVAMRDLSDAYEGVEIDLASLITAGDVLAVANPEDKDKILFPRGETFLVELDGHVTLPSRFDEEDEDEEEKKDNGGKALTDDEVVLAAIKRAKMEKLKRKRRDACHVVLTDVDPRKQIRRGEAVCVGGQWFRVSSAVREGVPLSEQPARAQAPPSVVLRKDLSAKNDADGYIRPFDEKRLPTDHPMSTEALKNLRDAKRARERLHKIAGGRGVSGGAAAQLLSSNASASNPATLAAQFASTAGAHQSGSQRKRPTAKSHPHHHGSGGGGGGTGGDKVGGGGGGSGAQNLHLQQRAAMEAIASAKKAASDPALLHSHARRHGCTKDVRDMYLATRDDVPVAETDLYKLMLDHKLIEPSEATRRPRMKKKANVDNDGKPKKRRYYERKGQRMTNTHLVGTEIGAALARAAEKQQQGKQVGDGGM